MDSTITTKVDEGGGGTRIEAHSVEATAAEKVFALPELLEAILIQVGNDLAGMKSLFVLQGVNTTFNDMINSSSKLKRIMFKQGTNKDSDTEPVLNPLFFDKSVNRVLYPAILADWKPTSHTTIPTADGPKQVIHSCLSLRQKTVRSVPGFLNKPTGYWQELKICHSKDPRDISAWSLGKNGWGHNGVRFGTNVHMTMGSYLDFNVFQPRQRKTERKAAKKAARKAKLH